MTTWNNIPKASGTSWTSVVTTKTVFHSGEQTGNPIGLLLALTYQGNSTNWTDVPKASGTVWTKITKAS